MKYNQHQEPIPETYDEVVSVVCDALPMGSDEMADKWALGVEFKLIERYGAEQTAVLQEDWNDESELAMREVFVDAFRLAATQEEARIAELKTKLGVA